MSSLRAPAWRAAATLVVCEVVLAVTMWPLRSSRFGVLDDHTIVEVLHGRRRLPLADVPGEALRHMIEPVGRFRPLYWLGQMVEAATAGSHPTWWYVDRYVLAAITLAALFLACLVYVDAVAGGLIALSAVLGAQFDAWSRLGAAEAYAMPLFAAGIAVIVVRHRSRPGPGSAAPGLLLLGLAALAKENFLLPFVIALVVLVLVAGPRRLGRRDWVVVGSLGAFALADLVAIALRLSAHGSQYAQVRSVASARQWAGYALRALVEYQGLYFALFFLVVLVALDPGRRSRILLSVALALVLFGSQVAFYAGSEQAGRYLYPAVLVGPLLWVLVADRRHRAAGGRSRSVVVTGVLQRWSIVALVPALALGVTGSHRVSERTALTTQSFQRNLHDIEREVREAGVRVVVLEPDDPLTDQEPVLSLARYLSADLGVTVMTLPAPHDAPGLSRELGRQITDWSRHGGSALSPYRTPARCLAIVFGTQRSECALAVPPPY